MCFKYIIKTEFLSTDFLMFSFMNSELQLNEDTFKNSFVVFKLNGKQYKIYEGDIVKVEKLNAFQAGERFGKSTLIMFRFKSDIQI